MARVYVGTWKKYNEGNLYGAWLDLADYETYEEFIKACKKLHNDEQDAEIMIQDSEEFPDGMSITDWLSKEDFEDVKKAMKEEEETEEETEIEPSVKIVDYSEKSFAVIGDTYPIKDKLKKLGGTFNRRLSCGAGWIFTKKSKQAVEEFILTKETKTHTTTKDNKPKDGQIFTEWLKEYLEKSNETEKWKDYEKKENIGAVKIQNKYWLIEKPHIENQFCFHDEGPQYELYKKLTSKDELMKKYFLNENLEKLDKDIKHFSNDEETSDNSVWWRPTYDGENCIKINIILYNPFSCRDRWFTEEEIKKYTKCTDEEKKLILKALKYSRELFKKRLDAYLKKYGVSKLNTWTYWADR